MAQVGNVIEVLTGVHPSPSAVSRVFHSLETEFAGWKQRKLKAHYLYVFADGTYFTVIYDQNGCKMPILAFVGIDEDGRRDVLAFSVGERENQQAWEDVLENLKSRGVEQVDLWITDGNRGMLNAIEINSPARNDSAASSIRWTMCWATSRKNSKTRCSPNSKPSFIRPVEKKLTKSWPHSPPSMGRSTRPLWSACSAISKLV